MRRNRLYRLLTSVTVGLVLGLLMMLPSDASVCDPDPVIDPIQAPRDTP